MLRGEAFFAILNEMFSKGTSGAGRYRQRLTTRMGAPVKHRALECLIEKHTRNADVVTPRWVSQVCVIEKNGTLTDHGYSRQEARFFKRDLVS